MAPDEHSKRMEMICTFVELFEDFLERKGIDIPNEEKNDIPEASLIYGSDYFALSDEIENALIKFGFIEKEG